MKGDPEERAVQIGRYLVQAQALPYGRQRRCSA